MAGVTQEIVNWLSLPVLGVLICVLLLRKVPRTYPAFFAYIVAEFLCNAILFAVYYSGSRTDFTSVYRTTYWATSTVVTVLATLVTYELFLKRIFPAFQRIRFYRYLFSMAALIIIVLAGLETTGNINLKLLFKLLDGIEVARAATIFFFIALMLFMGRRWQKHEFGIALGMAIDACTFLAGFIIPMFPQGWRLLMHKLPTLGFDTACIVWLIYFALPEKQATVPPAPPVVSELVQDAHDAEENLKDWLASRKQR